MKYDMNTGNLTLTVTELVSLAYPAGDIHHRAPSGAYVSRTARTAFLEAHGGEEAFTSDAPVSASVERPDTEGTEIGFSADDTPHSYHILLSDQIDGIVTENKDCPRIYHLLPDAGYDAGGSFRSRERAAHRVKAALYCIANGCSGAELSAVTVRREGGLILCEEEYRTKTDLTESLREILCAVLPTLDFLVRHRTVTLPKAGEVCFPYSAMRDGQEDLIRAVYRAIRTRKRLFAQAPTGIGKTISTLYPAVRALGNGYADKIFYLTAKASTRREAFSASERLFHAGARLRTCVISAKEQVCLCEKPTDGEDACNPFDCPYADGYYERAPRAILELLQRHHGFPREAILEAAREHTVCPYELSLDLSEKCDIIICDYNYIFDPQVYFRRYFGETRTFDGQYVFLIDEGHNLADRARDMYSASLSRSRFRAVRDEIPEGMTGLRAALSLMDDTFARLRLLCDDTLQKDASGEETGFFMSREAPKFLDETLGKVADVLKEARRTLRGHPYRAAVQG
ncbi:MAG: hypothetical protein J6B77_05145, partial [Clostridia bacterium]|nr:hypothetical protein [Clostridia bacterium]